ncbi:MAG: hypothetical protein WCS69_15870 [Ignavibacteriaceae bacterium]|jgi:glycine cleavage system H lipoate-binding protein
MVAIFVLVVFLSFISIDLIVLKIQGKYHPAFEPAFFKIDLSKVDGTTFTIPSNIFFSKGHTWLKRNAEGLTTIGIDTFGTVALGAISIVNCAAKGKELKRGDTIFEGIYGNKVVKFLSPVNGIVKSVNTNIIGKNISNPYDAWGVQLSSKDFNEDSERFFTGIEAANWMKKEFIKLKMLINNHSPKVDLAGVTMYDGGILTNDAVSSLMDKSAIDFEKEFLSL